MFSFGIAESQKNILIQIHSRAIRERGSRAGCLSTEYTDFQESRNMH